MKSSNTRTNTTSTTKPVAEQIKQVANSIRQEGHTCMFELGSAGPKTETESKIGYIEIENLNGNIEIIISIIDNNAGFDYKIFRNNTELDIETDEENLTEQEEGNILIIPKRVDGFSLEEKQEQRVTHL